MNFKIILTSILLGLAAVSFGATCKIQQGMPDKCDFAKLVLHDESQIVGRNAGLFFAALLLCRENKVGSETQVHEVTVEISPTHELNEQNAWVRGPRFETGSNFTLDNAYRRPLRPEESLNNDGWCGIGVLHNGSCSDYCHEKARSCESFSDAVLWFDKIVDMRIVKTGQCTG